MPLGLFTAVSVYRRLPVGYLLSAVVIVKGASIALGIVAMLVVEWFATGEPQLPPILIFGLTALAGFAIAVRIYRGIDAPEPSTAATGGEAASSLKSGEDRHVRAGAQVERDAVGLARLRIDAAVPRSGASHRPGRAATWPAAALLRRPGP